MKELSTFVLENGALSVIISPVGAELQGVVCGGVERMWSGDPAVWGRRAPLLFPLIGRLRDGWYANGGRRVDAPMHGFCRDRLFAAEQESGARVRFETISDEQTRAVYPFDFRLTVDFSLEGSSIVKSHTVENLGDVPLPFELGGHEAYATRLLPGERMADCFVRFEDIDKLEMFGMDEAGILTLPKIEVPLDQDARAAGHRYRRAGERSRQRRDARQREGRLRGDGGVPRFPLSGHLDESRSRRCPLPVHRALVRAARRSVLPARAVREARRAHARSGRARHADVPDDVSLGGAMDEKRRCSWAGDVPVYVDYHDNEWGKPTHDDRMLFELLVLEGAQAGLSWLTILKKREAYREALDGFDPAKVALYDEAKVEELMTNEGIVRNRRKIDAAITNAKLFLDVTREFGSFDAFIWDYVDGEPIVNRWKTQADVPATTPLSDRISKDLKKRGFKFVGSTIVYAYLQSIGIVNDHVVDCFAYRELTS